MIIHHKDNIRDYRLITLKRLQYLDGFSFIPLKLVHPENPSDQGFLQSPLMFSPYGIQTHGTKSTLDLSFMNQENDPQVEHFYQTLVYLYETIHQMYSQNYTVQPFLKQTTFHDTLRLKVNPRITLFDQRKQPIDTVPSFSYGCFMIHLHGLWISDTNLWFQWYVDQGKILVPISLPTYGFLDDPQGPSHAETPTEPDKYEKMLRMGVPKEAVDRQRALDHPSQKPPSVKGTCHVKGTKGPVPPPPPLPTHLKTSSEAPPRISATDLQSVSLRSTRRRPEATPRKPDEMGYMEPPSLSDILSARKTLKPVFP
jgi:hypothetical protein